MPGLRPISASLGSATVCLIAQATPYSSWNFCITAFWPATTGLANFWGLLPIWWIHSFSSWREGNPRVTALFMMSLVMYSTYSLVRVSGFFSDPGLGAKFISGETNPAPTFKPRP